MADCILEEFGGCPVRGRVAGAVGSVEADDGVVVDDAAGLVFGDLGVGERGVLREPVAREAGGVCEVAAQVDGEA